MSLARVSDMSVLHQDITQHTNDLFQVEELDLPEDKCNVDKNYDFNGCVRKSLSRQVEKGQDAKKFSCYPGGLQDQVGCMESERCDSDPFISILRKCDDKRAQFLENIFSSLF